MEGVSKAQARCSEGQRFQTPSTKRYEGVPERTDVCKIPNQSFVAFMRLLATAPSSSALSLRLP